MVKRSKKLSKSSKINGTESASASQQGTKRPKKRPIYFDELKIPDSCLPSSSETASESSDISARLANDFLSIPEERSHNLIGINSVNQTTVDEHMFINHIPRKKKCQMPKKVEFKNDTSIFVFKRDVQKNGTDDDDEEDNDAPLHCSEGLLEHPVRNHLSSHLESEISDEEQIEEQVFSSTESDIEFSFLKDHTYELKQENDHEFYITLYKDAIIYMHGLISLIVLQGSVEILGYKLNASDKTFDVYSPAGSSLLSVSNCTDRNTGDNALILCKRLNTRLSRTLSQYAPKNIFPPLQENGTECIVNSREFFDKFTLLEPSPQWKFFANALTSKSRVIIAGNKGTGKSTLLRYLINQLLSKDRENQGVLVVDLDPGQPEFTPQGCISIVVAKSPLFGPNYTHQQKPEKCVHVSSVDIKYSMDEYIRCCKYLLSFIAEYPNIPTLINYIGFSKGLGQQLISTIISFANPTNVVQINDPNGKYNFRQDLTIENVKEDSKWIPNSTYEDVDLSFELVKFETVHNYNNFYKLNYTAGESRDIAIVSYFSKVLRGDPLCFTDPSVKIYQAPLDKLKIQDSWGNFHPAIINANLVSLCQKVTFENSDIFLCLGWGVVRCVSIPRNVVYLLTPLKLDVLEEVKYLVLSASVRLPLAMYITTAKDISGQIPYIEDGRQTDLEKPSKRQHYNHEKATQ